MLRPVGKRKRKKGQGYYCWCCERMRPNERFSRWGRMRHVCKVCQRLSSEELAFRQAQRDIDRTRGFSGGIRRKHRPTFERFLEHDNPRVRAYAEEVQQYDAALREMSRLERLYEEDEIDRETLTQAYRAFHGEEHGIGEDEDSSGEDHDETVEHPWDDIPF